MYGNVKKKKKKRRKKSSSEIWISVSDGMTDDVCECVVKAEEDIVAPDQEGV